ncbi:MAG TPA: ceramidase domain-containing protein [Casimicrobiaceae bacterium]|nr:ceramidase domain-containing protein [Casimicrobiaceae bacterium]
MNLSRCERWSIAFIASAVVLAFLAPAIAQPSHYHAFADRRSWLGVANAANVLSNIAFIGVGIVGVARLIFDRRFNGVVEACLWSTAIGLALTGVGSIVYHLAPDDTTLVFDRLPMTLGFAGVFATAVAQRVSLRMAQWVLFGLVLAGPASVAYWSASGNLTAYVVVQYVGALGLLMLVALTRRANDPFPWTWVIILYALAKCAELLDHAIFEATNMTVAGHMVKHLLAAAAGAAALWPLFTRRLRDA